MAAGKLRYVRFWLDPWLKQAKTLSDEDAGRLFKAALNYADTGEDTNEFGDTCRFCPLDAAWIFQRAEIDRDAAHVRRKAEWRRRYGKG